MFVLTANLLHLGAPKPRGLEAQKIWVWFVDKPTLGSPARVITEGRVDLWVHAGMMVLHLGDL